MLAGLKRRLTRRHIDIKECDADDDKDDLHTFPPPANYIKISQGKIQLVHQTRSLENDTIINEAHAAKQDKEILENRIVELEGALLRIQEQFKHNHNKNQCGSPTFEKELREQLENMNRVIRTKERKQMQTCREHKALQTRFARQESLLHSMQQENRALLLRIRQYEHCLDDVMRKVVDAIVAEDNLREEVAMLKSRVRDLEAQNAALSASPAKGRDEGYCTMSSGQPQPSNGHLEDLPEEPEQWLLPAEPCSTEMEDWSMSQEELAVITLDDEREHMQHVQAENEKYQRLRANLAHAAAANGGSVLGVNGSVEHNDWLWRTNELLNSTLAETDSIAESITQLLQQKIVYSEDEEIACTDFTNDFYKLVNIRSNSAHSLYSYIEGDTDDEDDDDDDDDEDEENDAVDSSLSAVHIRAAKHCPPSPTPSEAGQAQLTSCSSSETEELSTHCTTTTTTNTTATATKTLLGNTENDYEIIDELERTTTPSPLSGGEVVNDESDIELTDMLGNDAQQQAAPHQLSDLNERQCIADIIKNELRRPPHILVKSQSMLENDEQRGGGGCVLRNQRERQEMLVNALVKRSGSINCGFAAKANTSNTNTNSTSTSSNASTPTKGNVYRLQQQRSLNSWRRSNGWKRVTSPAHSPTTTSSTANANANGNHITVSSKKETKSEIPKSFPQKLIPTKIPTCLPPQQQQSTSSSSSASHSSSNKNSASNRQQQQQQKPQTPQLARKSKIPPPVPIRRSYAS